VFDFFGFMWTCIIVNFMQIILVIAALFGVCQDRAKIVIVVCILHLLLCAAEFLYELLHMFLCISIVLCVSYGFLKFS